MTDTIPAVRKFCQHCGTAVIESQRFCGACGVQFESSAVLPPPPTRKRHPIGTIFVIVGACCALWGLYVVLSAFGTSDSGQNSPQRRSTPTLPTSTGNPSNDRLLTFSDSQQASALGDVVGDNCVGIRAFYMGMGKSGIADGKAFWSVQCASGASWAVEVDPDSKGTTTVLECSMLELIAKVNCFEKMSGR
jgi:hypothetical protein